MTKYICLYFIIKDSYGLWVLQQHPTLQSGVVLLKLFLFTKNNQKYF